jgi:predicted MFS family arabinose efflux permease
VTGGGSRLRIRDRFAGLPGWLRLYLLGRFVSAAGALAWLYLTLYLVSDRGLDPQPAGLIAAGYGVGLLLGNLVGGWFGDHFGMRRGVLTGLLSWAVLCMVMSVAPVSLLGVVGGFAGVCIGAVRPMDSVLVAMTLPAERRREAVALTRTMSNAGFMVGPPLGALLFTWNFNLVFYVDAGTSALLALLVWAKVPASAGGGTTLSRAPSSVFRALAGHRSVIVLLAAVLVVDTVYRQLYTSLPLLLRDSGAPAVAYGLLITLNAGVIVLCEAPIAVALRSRPAVTVIAAGFALVALGFVAIAVWPAVGGAVLAVGVITIGEMLYKPTATAHVVDAAPDGMAGRFSSLYAAASIGGMTFAPALGGSAYQYLPNLLWTLGALAAFAAAGAMWLFSQESRLAGRT